MDDTILRLFKSFFIDSKTKIIGEPSLLIVELIKAYNEELVLRTVEETKLHNRTTSTIDDFEKVFLQHTLDFY